MAVDDKVVIGQTHGTDDPESVLIGYLMGVEALRKGKQVVNLRAGATLKVVRPLRPEDDFVAAIGDNRKLVVFSREELPEMGRGQGVQLQRYRDGGLSDAKGFNKEAGLSWPMGGEGNRVRTENMDPWRTARGAAGRMPPTGFPRDNRF